MTSRGPPISQGSGCEVTDTNFCGFWGSKFKSLLFNQLVHFTEVGFEPVRFCMGVQPLTRYTAFFFSSPHSCILYAGPSPQPQPCLFLRVTTNTFSDFIFVVHKQPFCSPIALSTSGQRFQCMAPPQCLLGLQGK